jgi:hypothetical protein
MALFTGVYPPSPPPCAQKESNPELQDHPNSDVESIPSTISSLPPKPTRKPFSSRLRAQHLALSKLEDDIIAPPSRETTPEAWKRAAGIREELLDCLRRFQDERISAECGAAYLGDHTKLFCTQFAKCEWVGPRHQRKKKRRIGGVISGVGESVIEEVWDIGYGMGLPPLVDTDKEWEEWEKRFEERKKEVREEQRRAKLAKLEEKKRKREERKREKEREREKDRGRVAVHLCQTTPGVPVPVPVAVPAPTTEEIPLVPGLPASMGLDTRVENWRNSILPSSQLALQSQIANKGSDGSSNLGSEPRLQQSQNSQLSFKVVKNHAHAHASSSVKKKSVDDKHSLPVSGPVSRIERRRELPPSVPMKDLFGDIFVGSSQLPRSQHQLQSEAVAGKVEREDGEPEAESVNLKPNGMSEREGESSRNVLNETQETDQSLHVSFPLLSLLPLDTDILIILSNNTNSNIDILPLRSYRPTQLTTLRKN